MAVDASAVARVVGIRTEFVNLRSGITFLPRRIAVIGQGNSDAVYETKKQRVTSAAQAGNIYGYGSPIYQAVRQLLPQNGDGVGTIPVTVYPLEDATDSVAAAGEIAVVGPATETGAYRVLVNNIRSEQFVIRPEDSDDDIAEAAAVAINSVLAMPVVAEAAVGGIVEITAKWAGESGNDIHIEIDAPAEDVTFGITQPNGGLINPDVQPALDKIGNVWETDVLNCLNVSDTDALDALAETGEGRWGPVVRKPFVAYTGNTTASVDEAITISSDRRTDRINAQLVAPGSYDLPVTVAARQLARIARTANNNPPRDYGSLRATGLTPGDDAEQWTYPQRDQAVKAGSSTIEVKDGVINLSDIVTFWRPQGEEPPAYRYVVDIVKLQNIIFNLDLRFATPSWDGAPLIPDDQATINPDARKPSSAVSEACAVIDDLALNALISDPETAKANTFANIDTQNPKRLNLQTTVQLSGNSNIMAVGLNFGFYFGTAQEV